ncbi:MAG: hypothetical protein RIM23_22825 [Coleofasciculus sp. G3-WIS-01]|uniref:hypothetical protein n=1 Tax=Coleofasciculus sp. G3-WIS-01 TaxID=3069528 RepID=UPI003303941F
MMVESVTNLPSPTPGVDGAKELAELGLRQEGVVVLGIQRENGRYVGAPKGNTHIRR